MQDLEYSVEASQSSMAGIDKGRYNLMLSSFLQGGHITFDEFLQVADLPKSEKIRELVMKRQDIQGQMQSLQQENIMLKAQAAPETMTEEEKAMYEEIVRQQALQQQMGVTSDQPM